MKICPVVDEFFYADRQTDGHDKANSRFLDFAKVLKKYLQISFQISRTRR